MENQALCFCFPTLTRPGGRLGYNGACIQQPVGATMPFGIGRGSNVAVVEMHGVIGSQIRSTAYSRVFESVAKNKSYRALLLDIDSPGGSAAASESLHRSIERVAENKPVLAYVRNIGASGGVLPGAPPAYSDADFPCGLHRSLIAPS